MHWCCDIDNTIADTNSLLHRLFEIPKDVYPAPVSPNFWKSGTGLLVFSRANPIAGAREFVENMARRIGPVVYVTNRPPVAEFVTKRWLRMHGFPEGPVVFCKGPEGKLLAARRYAPALAVDDDPEAVKMYSFAGIAVLMPGWPYNEAIDLPNVLVVREVAVNGYE